MAENETVRTRRRQSSKASKSADEKKRKCNFVLDSRVYMRLMVAAADQRKSRSEVLEEALKAHLGEWNIRLPKDFTGEAEAAA